MKKRPVIRKDKKLKERKAEEWALEELRKHPEAENNKEFTEAVSEALDLMDLRRVRFANQKVEDLISRIEKSIPEEEKTKELSKDCRLNNLYVDLANAKKANRLTSCAIIQRQIEARGKEVLILQAEKKLEELVESGQIISFLDEDDMNNFYIARMQVFLVMDILDSALNDLTDAIRQAGMMGECTMLPALVAARKEISFWCDDIMKKNDETAQEAIYDECESLNKYIHEKRVPILHRKLQKIMKKIGDES